MPESLATELSVFLRLAREEILSETTPANDPFKPHRAQRIAVALTHLMAQAQSFGDIDRSLAPAIGALLAKSGESTSDHDADTTARLAERMHGLAHMARDSESAAAACKELVRGIRDLESRRLQLVDSAIQRLEADERERLATRRVELPALTAQDVTRFLRNSFPTRPEIDVRNFEQPKGVYSKENYRFDIVGMRDEPVPAILRRDRNFEIVPTSAAKEFDLLSQLHARGLPVARCLAVQYDDAPPLGHPCLLMERIPGTTPSKVDPKSAQRLGPDSVTREMILQLADPLARLHGTDTQGLAVPYHAEGSTSRELFLQLLDHYHDQLRRVQREPFPILEAAFGWLYANSGLIDNTITLVHADYDLRNVLFDKGRLTAVLDFELAHLGHPAEDLGYLRKDIEALIPWPDFLAAYEAAGGRVIPDELIRYFQVWANAFHGTCNVTAFSGFRSGVHSDMFLGTLCFIEFQLIQRRLVELLPGEA